MRHRPGSSQSWLNVALLLSAMVGSPAVAQEAIGGRSVVEAAQSLAPGEFLWAPNIAPEGPVLLIVSMANQRAVLYRNAVPIAVTTVSTGQEGYRTPTGVFTILQKQVRHFSNIYDNAPMPYMQRLTWGGIALHAGQLPGYPASHGCIRLPLAFAKLLFDVTHLGMTVIVTAEAGMPRLAPTRDPLPEDAPAAGDDSVQWHPERQPTGPLSVVASAADRRLIVLRGGREIGRAPLALDAAVSGTRAYVLRAEGNSLRWSRILLPGEVELDTSDSTGDSWRKLRVDPAFRARLRGALVAGTTVVLTSDSLRPGAKPVALLKGEPEQR